MVLRVQGQRPQSVYGTVPVFINVGQKQKIISKTIDFVGHLNIGAWDCFDKQFKIKNCFLPKNSHKIMMNILCLASIVDLQVSLKVSKISSFTFYTRTLKKGRCDNPKVRASNFNRTKL